MFEPSSRQDTHIMNNNHFDPEQYILAQQLRARERAQRNALLAATGNYPLNVDQNLLPSRGAYLPPSAVEGSASHNAAYNEAHQLNLLQSMMLMNNPRQQSIASRKFSEQNVTGFEQVGSAGLSSTPQVASLPPIDPSSFGSLLNDEDHQQAAAIHAPTAPDISIIPNSASQLQQATPSKTQKVSRSQKAPAKRNYTTRKKKDTKWLASYEELKEYKEEHGDCIVPRGYPLNSRLASWVAEQRKQYKLLKDGRPSSITQERIRLLNELDFAWNAQEAAYARHLNDLKSYKEEFGDTLVPLNHPKYPKLGLWVKEQRRHFALLKAGKPSHMTEDRAQSLDELSFCWDTHEEVWSLRLKELCEYKAQHGNCVVPTNYGKLGTWVHHQRREFKKFKEGKRCHITEERIRALESLGFIWYPRDRESKSGKRRSSTPPEEEEEEESESEASSVSDSEYRPPKRQRKNSSW